MGQQQSTRNGRKNIDSTQTRASDQRIDVAANSQLSADASASSNSPQNTPVAEQRARVKGRSISQSFRRSVIGLVKPSTSHNEEEDDGPRQQKKWRRSRRWSKAPLTGLHGELSEPSESGMARNETAEGSSSAQAVENQLPSMATTGASAVNPPSLSNDKAILEESRSSEGMLSEQPASNESNTGASETIPTTTPNVDRQVEPQTPAPTPHPAAQSEPVPPRVQSQGIPNHVPQFPPAGTLVVVQGVVHTSDTDRTARQPSQPRPRSRTPVSARRSNLLSGLLRRRNSTASLTTLDSANAHSTQGARFPSEDAGAGANTASDDSVSNASDGGASSQTSSSVQALTEPSSQPPPSDNLDNQRSQLSSNSLDVLGALLSVATAATAASLLSAPTSRPPPVGGVPGQAPIGEPPSAIPALARALANANPAAAAALLQHDRDMDREEQERNRVRNLWDNLRQRLVTGRGRNQPPLPQIPGGASPARERTGNEHAIPDALFSELARAFNLNSPHDDMQPDEPFEDQLQRVESGDMPIPEEENIEEAPPGSFERFLIDLQVDLRTALSRNDGENEPTTGPSREPASSPVAAVNAPTSTGSALAASRPESEQSPESQAARSEMPGMSEAVLDISPSTEHDSAVTSDGEDSDTRARRMESEPSVLNATNTVSEGTDSMATSLPALSNIAEPASSTDEGATTSNERINAQRAGISWWRTYRFPPMRLNPRPQGAAPTGAAQSVNSPSLPESTSTQENGTPSTSEGGVASTSESAQEHMVVPVIVVGLQSINGSRTRANGNGAQRNSTSASPQAIPQPDSESVPSTPTAAQQDGWRSRAARAFGGLGRRSASADPLDNRREPTESGSRTFFIYVFGGYYPPNHHMVTGSGNLDSFEALWELAELLGPAKPPVATESDIEKSGLEVFKAKLVTDYEKGGRVSNNCVDKCLICLDDYEDEDDLRLLSCKHAFHRTCVDHWLKTGRNNCPACRSTGVKTGDEVLGASSTTSTA